MSYVYTDTEYIRYNSYLMGPMICLWISIVVGLVFYLWNTYPKVSGTAFRVGDVCCVPVAMEIPCHLIGRSWSN